jgi:hypothetical protein
VSRWLQTGKRSPSGRMLYVCSECLRESPTPDKTCLASGCGFASEEERAEAQRVAVRKLKAAVGRFRERGSGGV